MSSDYFLTFEKLQPAKFLLKQLLDYQYTVVADYFSAQQLIY